MKCTRNEEWAPRRYTRPMTILLGLLLLPILIWAWWRYGAEEDAFATLSIVGLLLVVAVVAGLIWTLLL